MKANYLWTLLLGIIFIGCDDNTGSLGLDMLPGSDKLVVKTKTYKLETRSTLSGPVYAKTNKGYIGKFTDPDFGFYETGFLTQLNCTENFKFPEPYDPLTETGEMAGDTIFDVFLQLSYQYYFGDSLNACRMSVYELNKVLDKKKAHYTDINPEDYYSPEDLIGRKAYTAVDWSHSDSIRSLDTYTNAVTFTLPKEFGNKILRLNREHPEYFKNSDAFIENVFKGIYAKSDYGDGTILYIDQAELMVRYAYHLKDDDGKILKKTDGTDSIGISGRSFASTKEVIQANKFTNSDKLKEKTESDEEQKWTYIKSPAGIFTQASLPIQQIYDELHADTLNSVKLAFTGYLQKEHDKVNDLFKMSAPANVLLIREKDVETFFETNSLYDNITSYLTQYDTNNQYVFSNITRLINYCIAEKEAVREEEGKDWTAAEWAAWEKENKWNSVVLVPVLVNKDSSNATVSIQHDMRPEYVKLKGGDAQKGGDELELEVHYTEFY
ncbi:DUF4270 domain-containing protein [Bacteroides sp. OttesenSCG-928-E20]|nr:DUF4270 domain-containing protein [Bacteroides sp. OttesenSCG-928-N06]MDL2299140.1 DUF4270 domain-containing protein [Bacteroides sp. OttesenSCG-928-E20]